MTTTELEKQLTDAIKNRVGWRLFSWCFFLGAFIVITMDVIFAPQRSNCGVVLGIIWLCVIVFCPLLSARLYKPVQLELKKLAHEYYYQISNLTGMWGSCEDPEVLCQYEGVKSLHDFKKGEISQKNLGEYEQALWDFIK